jgi:hypothetical protein
MTERCRRDRVAVALAHLRVSTDDPDLMRLLSEARSPALSMRFRLCSSLRQTATSSALTWSPPSTARWMA